MKKIGFIDYYLDEWHANNYPKMIEAATNGEMKVCFAYGKIDSPSGIKNTEWAQKNGVELLTTIEQVIEVSDYIIILSPDNPEMHEELCIKPAESGKRVYIDKTFAPDRATAEKIFDRFEKYNTPCYSCSALYFSEELRNIEKNGIAVINSVGPGAFEMYSIHQIEQIVALMGYNANRVMFTGTKKFPSMTIEFSDGRYAHISLFNGAHFSMNIGYNDLSVNKIVTESDYFTLFIRGMVEFFKTGIVPVSHKNTLSVIAIREAGIKSAKEPFTWVEI